MSTTGTPLTKKDFKSDQDVRWCPGCGDYSILNAVQTAFAELGKKPHEVAIVSGIGCSSRFPYYMETYGFHTLHGRAPTIATGLKLANPDLDVWVVTGDGDALSIGGNHLIHVLRRNVGLKILLFNNRIYGLTKGQFSPTSERGKKTKSTPMGSVDEPFSPIGLALGANATFVARSVDIFAQHLVAMVKRMDAHRGTSLLEIYQNCNIFNDGAYKSFTDKELRDDRVVELHQGKPLLFGKNLDKGLSFDADLRPRIVEKADAATWDEHRANPAYATALAHADEASLPVPIGVFRDVARSPFESDLRNQLAVAGERKTESLDELLLGNETWTVGS
ncbi:MAG: 2-oxoacid:ferredoxin oxidoreductase subunit beta [Planctomycetes bacterium]|nr:2-oxoacid:ferredoxin oxidoreductase subunit beta [Planctomycetota bacterium]